MRTRFLVVALLLALSVYAQDEAQPQAEPQLPAPASPAQTPAQLSPAQAPTVLALPPAAPKADALLIYNQGRNLDSAGKATEAASKYREAVSICDRELAQDPTRMDAYTVKCWSLFRLNRYAEVVSVGSAALKVKFDARVVEVMGESYFHLNDDAQAVKFLQRYIENSGEYADRVASAYFYMAESYYRQKKYDHADIAYAMATYRESNIARWWYRYGGAAEALGQWAKAAELYAKALRLSPGMQEALDGQSRVRARL